MYVVSRSTPGEMDRPAVAVYDLSSDAFHVMPGFSNAWFLNDGRHALLHEYDPVSPSPLAMPPPSKFFCLDFKTGDRIWETNFGNEYMLAQSVPQKHWVVFRPSFRSTDHPELEKWIVLDDRDGRKIAEWRRDVQAVSRDGVVVETDAENRMAAITGEGVRFAIDLGKAPWSRSFSFGERNGRCDRLMVFDIETLFNSQSHGINRFVNWKTLERFKAREWDLASGRELETAVQYHFCRGAFAWNGVSSGDSTFEIQQGDLFDLKWIERIEHPAQKNWRPRIAIGATPAVMLFALSVKRRRRNGGMINASSTGGVAT